jgi:CRISPR-associated protein Csb2
MVAAAAETGQHMAPLRHLESAPAIEASNAKTSTTKRYVPDNFRRSGGYHIGAEKHFPMAHPEKPVVGYLWQDVPEEAIPALERIAVEVTYVGRAASRVIVTPGPVEPTWMPSEQGDVLYRAPYPGRLADLQSAFKRQVRSSLAPGVGYQAKDALLPSAGWGDLLVIRPDRYLPMTHTALWANRLRRAVMSSLSDPIPAIIHGHQSHRHAAWIGLPDVQHKYASGHLLGLGVWMPQDATPAERGQVGSPMMRLREVNGIGVSLPDRPIKGLLPQTWARPSRVWATATPIVLDRQPRRSLTAEQSISDSIKALGLPTPVQVEVSRYSPLRGAPRSNGFRLRKPGRLYTHAVLEFDQLVAGPLLIGAERYFGLGLCRPLGE